MISKLYTIKIVLLSDTDRDKLYNRIKKDFFQAVK